MVTINSLLFRFGIVKCTKHPVLTKDNWCEIQLNNNIGKGDLVCNIVCNISYMGQAWGSCAPFQYLWQVQGIQNALCQVQLLCVCL